MYRGFGQLFKHNPWSDRRNQDEESQFYTVGRKETSDRAARIKVSTDDHSPERGAAVMSKSMEATSI